jgi:Kdo2-lipid IVA lauroyltransferase/acyltransferase
VVRRGGNIALLPDLTVPPQSAATVVKVFGVPTCMTAAHVEIARRCQAPMFVTICEPLADGRARLRVLDVIRPAEQGTDRIGQAAQAQRIWDHFEAAVRQRPELWLWMYRHWRYRPLCEESVAKGRDGPPGSDHSKYPDYAQEAVAFDSLYRHKAA